MEKSGREILVTLSASDQDAFGVRFASMSFADPKTRRFCEYMAVLVCLREDISDVGNVTVRAAESAAGELLLYFTCPSEEGMHSFSAVLEFESSDALLDSRHVFVSDPHLCAEVYRYAEKYYLWLEYETTSTRFSSFLSSLSEFGRVVNFDRAFLSEHADPLPVAVSLFLN